MITVDRALEPSDKLRGNPAETKTSVIDQVAEKKTKQPCAILVVGLFNNRAIFGDFQPASQVIAAV